MKSAAELRFLELLRQPVKSKEEVKELVKVSEIFEKELKYEIRGLSEELKKAGSKYSDPWDMVNTRERYPEAIDILVKHIPKPYHDKNREGIFRALTVKEAKGKANAALIEAYNKIPKEKHNLRWVIGNTFYAIITPQDVPAIISIIEIKDNGMSRYRFVDALGRVKSEQGEAALIKLLDDSEMLPYALKALGKLKSKKAKDKITLLANSSGL